MFKLILSGAKDPQGLKCWPLGSRLWRLIVKLPLSHWYPGSGVVLDCIDDWSFPSFLLWCVVKHQTIKQKFWLWKCGTYWNYVIKIKTLLKASLWPLIHHESYLFSCTSTTPESRANIWYHINAFNPTPPPRWLRLLSALRRRFCCCWLVVYCYSHCGSL